MEKNFRAVLAVLNKVDFLHSFVEVFLQIDHRWSVLGIQFLGINFHYFGIPVILSATNSIHFVLFFPSNAATLETAMPMNIDFFTYFRH